MYGFYKNFIFLSKNLLFYRGIYIYLLCIVIYLYLYKIIYFK